MSEGSSWNKQYWFSENGCSGCRCLNVKQGEMRVAAVYSEYVEISVLRAAVTSASSVIKSTLLMTHPVAPRILCSSLPQNAWHLDYYSPWKPVTFQQLYEYQGTASYTTNPQSVERLKTDQWIYLSFGYRNLWNERFRGPVPDWPHLLIDCDLSVAVRDIIL